MKSTECETEIYVVYSLKSSVPQSLKTFQNVQNTQHKKGENKKAGNGKDGKEHRLEDRDRANQDQVQEGRNK